MKDLAYFRQVFGSYIDLLLPRVRRKGTTVSVRESDNNQLAREVVYSACAAGRILKDSGQVDNRSPRELHEFMAQAIRYEADNDPDHQRLRMPWVTVWEGVTDCKSSAIFIGGIALAAGRDVKIRFIDEDRSNEWTHVYAIVDGFACDPLLPFADHPSAAQECTVQLHPIACPCTHGG